MSVTWQRRHEANLHEAENEAEAEAENFGLEAIEALTSLALAKHYTIDRLARLERDTLNGLKLDDS